MGRLLAYFPHMKLVIIIHGFGGKPNGGWRPWLMAELAKRNVSAVALAMPTPDAPIREEWIAEVRDAVEHHAGKEIYLVGHSLGGTTALCFLERWEGGPLAGTVLIGAPGSPTANMKTRPFLDTPFAYDRIREKSAVWAVIHGDRDDMVPVSHAEVHAQSLGVPATIVEGAGHFNSSDGCFELPVALDALLGMMQLR